MDKDEAHYPPTFQAVIDWTEEMEGNWDFVASDNHINFYFHHEGCAYSGTAIEENGESLTLTLVYELPQPIDELTLRRRISDVDIDQKYGALILNHELAVIVWRDSISSTEPESFDSEVIDQTVAFGISAFNDLRFAIADLLGVTASDMKLANSPAAGTA
mgnify:FL=1